MILHIIGLILKIIGIILLVILGILLLVIGVLLFVPLRYELRAEFPGKLEDAEGNLKISLLLHLIAGRERRCEMAGADCLEEVGRCSGSGR